MTEARILYICHSYCTYNNEAEKEHIAERKPSLFVIFYCCYIAMRNSVPFILGSMLIYFLSKCWMRRLKSVL